MWTEFSPPLDSLSHWIQAVWERI